MKTAKRVFALMMIVAIFLAAMPMDAKAASAISITIVNDVRGYAYEAYQIFSGDIADGTLSNIKWGDGISAEGQTALLAFEGTHETAESVAKTLTESNVADFAEQASRYIDSGAAVRSVFVPAANGNPAYYKITGLESGYYLIRNTSVATTGAFTNYIMEVVGDSSIRHKSSVPTVEKKVKEKNDSTGEVSDWQDSADYDVGDNVPFQLTAVLADNVSTYNWYKIEFQDTLGDGLSFNENSTKVYLADGGEREDITNAFSINASGDNLYVTCNDVKACNATNNSVIVVEYDASLNEEASIGAAGNTNEVVLAFSNNPYWIPEGYTEENLPDEVPEDQPVGYTPRDIVKVFAYEITVNKVDENDDPLPGATFALYKKEVNPEYDPQDAESEAFIWVKKESVKAEPIYNEGDATTILSCSATFGGIDSGEYKIREEVTPAGFNTCEDIEFTITADYDIESNEPNLQSLSGGDLTASKETGTIRTTIINKAGTVLPQTGGRGTALFYKLGGFMVLASLVLLIAKRKAR